MNFFSGDEYTRPLFPGKSIYDLVVSPEIDEGNTKPKNTVMYFVHQSSIGCEVGCDESISYRDMICEIYESNQVSGISCMTIKSPIDAQKKFVSFVAEGLDRYPFVVLKVSPFTEHFNTVTSFIELKGYYRVINPYQNNWGSKI